MSEGEGMMEHGRIEGVDPSEEAERLFCSQIDLLLARKASPSEVLAFTLTPVAHLWRRLLDQVGYRKVDEQAAAFLWSWRNHLREIIDEAIHTGVLEAWLAAGAPCEGNPEGLGHWKARSKRGGGRGR